MPLSPDDKQRIYEEEQEREEARRKIAFQREYGGFSGKLSFGLKIFQIIGQLGCAFILLFFAGLIIYLLLGH